MDQFGSFFRMRLDSKMAILKTPMGSFCTILLFVLVTAYTYQKIDVMHFKKDVEVFQYTTAGAFDDQYVFNFAQGLNIAVAFTAFDNEEENILDPAIGRVVFRRNSWELDATGQV